MNYSSAQLKVIAKNNPEDLVKIINNSSNITILTFGIEVLSAEVENEDLVLPVLKRLLKHIHALVRESSMLGISSFYLDKKPPIEILERLKVISNTDPSPVLKEYAKDLLKDFC